MKALVITRFGGPEVLELQQVPDAHPAPEQLLVKVEAGGLNFADLMTTHGGYAGTPKPPLIAGREFAGREFTGNDATGRRVMGYRQWHAVAGGVGTAAVQIGKILGIEMYGTSSSEDKLARVRELGLEHGINYRQRDYVEAVNELTRGEGVDAVFEMLGGEHVAKSVRCVRDFGRVIVYGAATGETPQLDTRLLYAKGASVHGLWLSYLSANRPLMESAWKQLSEWLAAGKLHPVIGKVFPLEEARAAYTLMQEGRNYGKIVLKIG